MSLMSLEVDAVSPSHVTVPNCCFLKENREAPIPFMLPWLPRVLIRRNKSHSFNNKLNKSHWFIYARRHVFMTESDCFLANKRQTENHCFLANNGMRPTWIRHCLPSATSVCSLRLQVYAALSYYCISPQATSVYGLKLLVYEALSCECVNP